MCSGLRQLLHCSIDERWLPSSLHVSHAHIESEFALAQHASCIVGIAEPQVNTPGNQVVVGNAVPHTRIAPR